VVVPPAASSGTSGRHENRRDRGQRRLGQPFAHIGRLVEGLNHRGGALAACVGDVQAGGAGVEPERTFSGYAAPVRSGSLA
jgi:hypothetical protein